MLLGVRGPRVDERNAVSSQRQLTIGKPEVIAYLHHAYPLSVAAAQPAFRDDWLFNNYLQLRCQRGLVGAQAVTEFDFYLPPTHFTSWGGVLRMAQVPPSLLWRARGEILEAIMAAIDQEFYVQVPADEFYVPRRAAYGQRHYVHELMLFGYDRQERTLDILGFDEQHEFGAQRIAFLDLEDAVALADLSQHYDRGGVRLYQLHQQTYPADPTLVSEFLDDYLAAYDTSQRFRALEPVKPGYLYGMAVYEELASFFQSVCEQPGAMDIRPLQLIWEHKRCMQLRLQRLVELGWLASDAAHGRDYEQVIERANSLRLLGLKYLMTNKGALLARIAEGLRELAELERSILTPVLSRLREKQGHLDRAGTAARPQALGPHRAV